MLIKKDPSRPYKLGIAFVIMSILAIAVKLKFGYVDFLDTVFIGAIQHSQSDLLEKFFTIVSLLASPKFDLIWMVLLAIFFWGCRYKVTAVWSLCLIVGGDVLGFVLKHIIGRARPSLHLASDDGFSFPSGHVLGMFLVISAVWILLIPIVKGTSKAVVMKTILVVWMILVMMSRVYLNAHFPSDVLGAALLAFTWLQVAEYLYIKYSPRLQQIKIFNNSLE
ncbi:phosphatase PAP2 family protein [Fructilactobacillus vespulae]|uniref:phosphatase PAP2 family protein n=1 Tax=Fructilactobacillus vespulae TaxID=1249630 RepID=UPI0039B5B9DB